MRAPYLRRYHASSWGVDLSWDQNGRVIQIDFGKTGLSVPIGARVLKRLIVIGMERACTVLDKIPIPYRWEGRWHLGGGVVGCYWLSLARRSALLDEKWRTGVWDHPEVQQLDED